MFSSVPAAVPTRDDVVPCDHPVPLTVLELDMGGTPSEGWGNFLAARGIAFRPDDLGRNSVSRGDARRLLDERRADELRRARLAALAEQEAVERDEQRRSQIWGGMSALDLPEGVTAGSAMLAAARESAPRRKQLSVLGDDDSMVFHSYQETEAS